jgi:hypothetical protein
MNSKVVDLQKKKHAFLIEHLSEFIENLQDAETDAEVEYMIHQWKTETRGKVLAGKSSWWRMFLVRQVVKLIDRHFAHRPTVK